MMSPKSIKSRHTILLATNQSQSVQAEVSQGDAHAITYTAYGHLSAGRPVSTQLGFNGELRESRTSWYMLGNGYRAYNPALMRFHSPDRLSPFGAGGVNPYMYCGADPINRRDPTGRVAVPAIAIHLAGTAGGYFSLMGIANSVKNFAHLNGARALALGSGGAGVLFATAAVATSSPVLAAASVAAGTASLTFALRGALAETARVTLRGASVASLVDTSTLSRSSLLRSNLSTPPVTVNRSPMAQPSIAPTHATTRAPQTPEPAVHNAHAAEDQEALLNRPERVTARWSDLTTQFVDETILAGQKIRSAH